MNRMYQGECHCGAIRFEVSAAEDIGIVECNCSICYKSGYLHLIVPLTDFRLISGEEMISSYRFGTEQARHTFCKHCGIKPFYYPRSHPDGISINVRCLDDVVPEEKDIQYFDGRNWEKNISALQARETDSN